MSLKRVALFLALLFGGGALALGFSAYAFGNTKDETAAWVQELKTDAYAPQRVIYPVD